MIAILNNFFILINSLIFFLPLYLRVLQSWQVLAALFPTETKITLEQTGYVLIHYA